MLSGFMYPFYFDPTYILIIIGMLIALAAQAKVKSTFNKYSQLRSHSGMTAAEVAMRILNSNGIYDVNVDRVSGDLTDHYDPKTKTLRLSDSTYNSTSVAAIGVAAHECGHAIQHHQEYVPLTLRNTIVPVVNICSNLSWPIILIGVIFSFNQTLVNIGILLFCAVVAFQLITLPVEYNASNRAIAILGNQRILYNEELNGAKKVLSAAALTYLAAAASSILQLLRLILLFGGRRRDD